MRYATVAQAILLHMGLYPFLIETPVLQTLLSLALRTIAGYSSVFGLSPTLCLSLQNSKLLIDQTFCVSGSSFYQRMCTSICYFTHGFAIRAREPL